MEAKKEIESKRRTFPAVCDIYQNETSVVLSMEMPGVKREDLDISVDNDRLLIHGRKRFANPEGEYRIREIRDGDYYHEFTIDSTIDRNKIDAAIKNGVVTLTLGIKESEKPRKITISVK
jgi:HSP20 family protein